MNIYDITVRKQDGTDQSMTDFQGQVLSSQYGARFVGWGHSI